jgi:hypothetical protein
MKKRCGETKVLKTMTAVLFAALIVGVTSFAPGVSEAIEPPAPQKSLKGDRLPTRAPVSACMRSAWPYYEAKCMPHRTQQRATPRIDYAPTILTNVDLDRIFAGMTERLHRDNTPANRDRLRNVGWKRIL